MARHPARERSAQESCPEKSRCRQWRSRRTGANSECMDDIDNDKIGKLLADLANADKALAGAQVVRDQRRRAAGFEKRRSRDQRLIQAGGLFVMAKLMDADQDVILGALIQAKSVDGKRQAWAGSGEQAFARWR